MILVVAGVAASAGGYLLSLHRDRMIVAGIALGGASLISAGAAKLFHGPRVRIGRMSPLMRRYAIVGSVLGVTHLFVMGFFKNATALDGFFVLLLGGLLGFGPARAIPESGDGSGEAGS